MEKQNLIDIMHNYRLYGTASSVKEAIEKLEERGKLKYFFGKELSQEELKEIKSMSVREVNRLSTWGWMLYKNYTREENALFNFLLRNQKKINDLMTEKEKAIFTNAGYMDPADFAINNVLPKLSAMSK